MTSEQMQLVRLSFIQVMASKTEAGLMFYGRLFVIAPELRRMFKTDIETQADKFLDMLGVAISLLQNPTAFQQTLTQLAHRHRNFGVRDEHYDKVGTALLWTLERRLGDTFTPELKQAWSDLYSVVASAMKRLAVPGRSVATAQF
jgi:nitric oxide dioxygenase